MKRLIGLMCSSILIAMLTSCTPPVGVTRPIDDVSDSNILDLRIKNNGIVYTPSKAAANFIEVTETDHVKVEKHEKGLKFTLKKPAGGWQYTSITRIEMISNEEAWTTSATVFEGPTGLGYPKETVEVIYPLCEPGLQMSFDVQFNQGNGDPTFSEKVSIIPENGIGVINYSNISKKQWLTLSLDGDTPVATLKNVIAPQLNNTKLCIEYAYGARDSKGNATWDNAQWMCSRNDYGVISCEDSEYPIKYEDRNSFYERMDSIRNDKGFTHNDVFCQFFYKFTVEESSGVEDWRTKAVFSNVIEAKEILSVYSPLTESAANLEKGKWYKIQDDYFKLTGDETSDILVFDYETEKYKQYEGSKVKDNIAYNVEKRSDGTVSGYSSLCKPVKLGDKLLSALDEFELKAGGSSDSITGTWEMSGNKWYSLKDDKTFKGEVYGNSVSGTWKYCDSGMILVKQKYQYDGWYIPYYYYYTADKLYSCEKIEYVGEKLPADVSSKIITE